MSDSILKAIANSSILLFGIQILTTSKYNKGLLVAGYITMIAASSFTFVYGFQAGIASLAIIILLYSRFTQDSWRYTFFIITNVIAIVVVSKYWSNFVALVMINHFNLTSELYLEVSLIIQIFVSFGCYRLLMRVFRGIGVHLFLETLDREYSRLLIIGLSVTVLFYTLVSYVPNMLDDTSYLITTIQTIYTTFLAILIIVLLTLFRYLVKHKIELQEKNATLCQVSKRLKDVEKDLLEKEKSLKYMDHHVATLSEARRKLMDFEHDQLNFIIALEGGIRSGDMSIMRESLEQYGAAVQEVLEIKADSLDLTHLYASPMMPVRYLILAKSQLANSQGIKFTLEIPTEVTCVGMDMKDFVRILGIWLDNALEEAIHIQEDKWIHVSFIQNFDEEEAIDVLEVRVSNSCRPKRQNDIAKLHDQGFTSKEGENRGNGLRIVNDLMFRHDNIHLETRVRVGEDKFTQLLSIALSK